MSSCNPFFPFKVVADFHFLRKAGNRNFSKPLEYLGSKNIELSNLKLSFLVYLMEEQRPLDRSWDYLIILDACRFDVFEEVYDDFLEGRLRKVESVGSSTPEWA